MKTPQFSAKFKPGVKYLRHTNGIVYPYMAALANNPNYTVVEFSKEVHIQDKPLGFIPTPPDTAVEIERAPQVEKVNDLAGSIDKSLLNPPLPEAAANRDTKITDISAQLLSGLDAVGE